MAFLCLEPWCDGAWKSKELRCADAWKSGDFVGRKTARIKKPEWSRAWGLEFEIYHGLKSFHVVIFVDNMKCLSIDVLCKFKNIVKHIFH